MTAGPAYTDGPAYVEYDRIASRYEGGRALADEVLDRWEAAVRPHLGPNGFRVADVGAGTGIFARVWRRWGAATVVAIEPSEAMTRAGKAIGVAADDDDVRWVGGVAEALPLRDGSIDVAWVSTALHHFSDPDRAAAELDRVLTHDHKTRLLIRTFLRTRTAIGWLGFFPGHAKALARFPDLDDLAALFGRHGFNVTNVAEVVEGSWSSSESADWVERMRDADSMLTALTDEEIAQGLDALRSRPAETARFDLSLVVLARP